MALVLFESTRIEDNQCSFLLAVSVRFFKTDNNSDMSGLTMSEKAKYSYIAAVLGQCDRTKLQNCNSDGSSLSFNHTSG